MTATGSRVRYRGIGSQATEASPLLYVGDVQGAGHAGGELARLLTADVTQPGELDGQ
jgi:hypothetical protein